VLNQAVFEAFIYFPKEFIACWDVGVALLLIFVIN